MRHTHGAIKEMRDPGIFSPRNQVINGGSFRVRAVLHGRSALHYQKMFVLCIPLASNSHLRKSSKDANAADDGRSEGGKKPGLGDGKIEK